MAKKTQERNLTIMVGEKTKQNIFNVQNRKQTKICLRIKKKRQTHHTRRERNINIV
jgi:hypothetical protein